MNRIITEAEMIYNRVREFVIALSPEELASLRVHLSDPKVIDYLRAKIKKGIGQMAIESTKFDLRYSFMYNEKEFFELIRQII